MAKSAKTITEYSDMIGASERSKENPADLRKNGRFLAKSYIVSPGDWKDREIGEERPADWPANVWGMQLYFEINSKVGVKAVKIEDVGDVPTGLKTRFNTFKASIDEVTPAVYVTIEERARA